MLARRKLIILLCLISMFGLDNSMAQSTLKLDLKNGFKDFKLGQRKMQFLLLDLEEVYWKAGVGMDTVKPEIENYITRFIVNLEKEEDKFVGPYKFNSVSLHFFKERLYEIVVTIQTEVNFLGIYETLRSKYGRPTSDRSKKEGYNNQLLNADGKNVIVWDGSRVTLQLSYDHTRYMHSGGYEVAAKSADQPEKSNQSAAVLTYLSNPQAEKMLKYKSKKKIKAAKDL